MIFQDSLFGSGGKGYCGVCGRGLTNPISIARGIGPICSGKGYKTIGGNDVTDSDITDRLLDIDLTEDFVLMRDERGVATNVPHLVTHHSPTGFEFGYGGSGPADLALNIVEIILHRLGYEGERTDCWQRSCFSLAFKLHQEFKWEFICSIPREGTTLSYEIVRAWVEARILEGERLLF